MRTRKHKHSLGKHSLGKHRAIGKHRTRKVYKGGAATIAQIKDSIEDLLKIQSVKRITRWAAPIQINNIYDKLFVIGTSLKKIYNNTETLLRIKAIMQQLYKNQINGTSQKRNDLLNQLLEIINTETPSKPIPSIKTHKKRESPNKLGSPKDAGDNWILYDAGGGGNCFYYSVFNALNEDKLLGKLQTALESELLDTLNKVNFNITMRTIVGDYLNTPAGITIFTNFYNFMTISLNAYYEEHKRIDVNDFCNKHAEYLPWLIKLYGSSRSFNQFKEAVIENIKKNGTYVQSLEIEIVKHLLKKAGIHLFVLQNKDQTYLIKKQQLSDETSPSPAIYIYNDPYGQGHFQWFKVAAAP